MEGFKANTSSYAVVAALFATITYAAHISPPGGVDPSTGYHVAKSAAFYVFFYSNFLAFWFSLGLLAAVLTLTANIDSDPCDTNVYPHTPFDSQGGDYYRWWKIPASAMPMYISAGIAVIAAGYITQKYPYNEEGHVHFSILAAGLVILYTGIIVGCLSRK